MTFKETSAFLSASEDFVNPENCFCLLLDKCLSPNITSSSKHHRCLLLKMGLDSKTSLLSAFGNVSQTPKSTFVCFWKCVLNPKNHRCLLLKMCVFNPQQHLCLLLEMSQTPNSTFVCFWGCLAPQQYRFCFWKCVLNSQQPSGDVLHYTIKGEIYFFHY